MLDEAMKAPVASPDMQASLLAALARIEMVPAGHTLIEEISEEDWHDEAVAEWNINVCSDSEAAADDLDDCDDYQ